MNNRKWKHKLNFSAFYHDEKLTIKEKGKRVSEAIKKLPLDKIELYCGDDFEELALRFEEVSEFECDGEVITVTEDFNNQMKELYDMADRYDIWISTMKRGNND